MMRSSVVRRQNSFFRGGPAAFASVPQKLVNAEAMAKMPRIQAIEAGAEVEVIRLCSTEVELFAASAAWMCCFLSLSLPFRSQSRCE